jgi:hypothetical protein
MRSGKMPQDNNLLHMCVKCELMKGELIFINLVDIPLSPEEFFGLKYFIMFSISLVDTDFKVKFGKRFLKDCTK